MRLEASIRQPLPSCRVAASCGDPWFGVFFGGQYFAKVSCLESAMALRNLLARLEGVDLFLLAPQRKAVGDAFSNVLIDAAAHRRWLAAVRLLRLRDGAFQVSDEKATESIVDIRDEAAWHILGVRADQLVGAIRVRVYDCRHGCPQAAELFAYSEVRIADPITYRRLEFALASHIAEQAGLCGSFYQVGGFIVSPGFKGSALAPVLALAVNVWVALAGLRGGCTFATVENNGAWFYQRVGAIPLNSDGAELPSFFCDNHQTHGKLLGIESGREEARLAETVRAIRSHLVTTKIITPH